MNDTFERQQQPVMGARPWARLAIVAGCLLVLAGCGGTLSPAASTAPSIAPSTAPSAEASADASAGASGAAACIDADTMAIIQSLTASGADVQAILTDKGDELIAGLQSFTPPADIMTWRDELIAAIQGGDAQAVQEKVAMIGSEVTLETC